MSTIGKRIFDALTEISSNELKIAQQNLIDIYEDNWDYIIKQELRRQFSWRTYENMRFLVTKELNVLKRIVNEISLVYKQPAKRTYLIDDEPDPNYAEIAGDKRLTIIFQKINKLTNLLNHILVKVSMRDGKIDYDLVTFNNAEILVDDKDWKRIIAIKYYIGMKLPMQYSANYQSKPGLMNDDDNTVSVFNVESSEYSKAYIYTLEDITIQDENGTIEAKKGMIYTIQKIDGEEKITSAQENPYKDDVGNPILPFVLVSKDYPVNKLLNFSSGNDIFDATINTALNMVHLNTLLKYQSYKQIWMRTDKKADIPEKIRADVTTILKLWGENSEIGTLDIETAIDKIWDTIQKRMQAVLSSYGVAAENFSNSAVPQSGYSLKISNTSKIEKREEQLPAYRLYEDDIFNVTRHIWNYHNPDRAIPEGGKFVADFGEIEFPMSSQEETQEFTFLKQNNATTSIDLIMQRNPDLDENEATKLYLKNKAINEKAVPVSVQPIIQPGLQPVINTTEAKE